MMAKWSLDLGKYSQNKINTVSKVRRIFVFTLYQKIVQRTPVDTGRARGNWQVTNAKPAENILDVTQPDYIKASATIESTLGDTSLFITNNLPYICKLEYGGYPKNPKKGNKTTNGFSKRAPHGMVGVTLASAGEILNQAIKAAQE